MYKLVVIVGDQRTEESYWGAPHMSRHFRPCFSIDPFNPGTEVAADAASALAAIAAVLKQYEPENTKQITEYLIHASELFNFAKQYPASYVTAFPKIQSQTYPSSGYLDELIYAGLWMHIATDDSTYLTSAENLYFSSREMDKTPVTINIDDKRAFNQLLLAKLTKSVHFTEKVKTFCDNNSDKAISNFTPNGLLYKSEFYPISQAAAISFYCAKAANVLENLSDNTKTSWINFAKSQANYMLENGYLIGLKQPEKITQINHRSSSCPITSACGEKFRFSKEPNAHKLLGAVLGGPDA